MENYQKQRDREHSIVIKGSILQEDITVLKVDACNIRASNYVKQELIEL